MDAVAWYRRGLTPMELGRNRSHWERGLYESVSCQGVEGMKQLKIVYVGPLWSGGTCLMRMRALQTLNHHVIGVDTEPKQGVFKKVARKIARRMGASLDISNCSSRTLSAVKRFQPDVVWIDKGLSIPATVLREIHAVNSRIRIIGYSPDDMGVRHNQSRHFIEGLPEYDWYFTTKTFNVNELLKMGAKRVAFVGNGFDPFIHKPEAVSQIERRSLGGPVTFIGAYEKERAQLMMQLAESDVPVRVWGCGRSPWAFRHKNLAVHRRMLLGRDYARAICATDVNLGFLRKANRDRQTTRSVEIPACGAFMLAERTDEHLALFEEGK